MLLLFLLFLISCVKYDPIYEIKNAYNPIYLDDGFGSSVIIKHESACYLVTANHVLSKESDLSIIENDLGFLVKIFKDEKKDLFVLKLASCNSYIDYVAPKDLSVGDEVHYWCMPAASDIKYYKGYISEIKEDQVVIFGYTWFGCSGSGIFTKNNELIGVVSSMMATPNPQFTNMIAHENIVVISIFKMDYIK